MSRSEKKASRLLQIEAMLVSHPEGLTQAEIARRLNVNRSTVNRYLPDLPKHIYIDDDGRWKIDREADLINIRLNLHEGLALHLATRLLATRMDRHNPNAASALRKLGIALERWAPRISRHLQQSADVMDDTAGQRLDPVYLEVLEKLTLAWAEQRKVRVWHRHEGTGVIHEYIFAPYFIEPYAVGQATHVIGYREPPGAMRTFKIERIARIEILRDTYAIPEDFDPRQLLAEAWGIWYTEAEPVEVVLKFHPRVAQRVQETRWHRSEAVEEQPDGSLLWRAWVAEPREMMPWIRGWGADVEVVKPEELRETMVNESRRLARLYGIAGSIQSTTSNRLLRLWGKTGADYTQPDEFHPALFHMLDAGYVAQAMLEKASPRWRRVLAEPLGVEANNLADWLPWFVALHDIGKISAPFQSQNESQSKRLIEEGFTFGDHPWNNNLYHTLIGQVFLMNEADSFNLPNYLRDTWRDIIGGHHGQFAAPGSFHQARLRLNYEPKEWAGWRRNAAESLKSRLLQRAPENWSEPTNLSAAIMALTGFTILCDWLSSDSNHFTMHPDTTLEEYVEVSKKQAMEAIEAAGFLQPCSSHAPAHFIELFPERCHPRPLQGAIDDIPAELLAQPCLVVIEAPTGEGKTEAALALAHRLAQASGSDELYYALPTTATSNQMFTRVQKYLSNNLGLPTRAKLIHSQAFLIEDDLHIKPLSNGNQTDSISIMEWFGPKKRAMLAPFGVGTIDQAELAALNVKHTTLRMIGLAGKVVIFDEVHAYDTYMTTIVECLLSWLSALGTSVILLSATLPKKRRAALVRAYGVDADGLATDRDDYPGLWLVGRKGSYFMSPPAQQPNRRISINALHMQDDVPEEKARWLVNSVVEGGCACWITNTVERAQRIYSYVDQYAPPQVDRMLLHARFPLIDREFLEKQLTQKYGPGEEHRPHQGIVIGTQVLEQSLDLDFDVMVSDIAPVDLLLQRAGRLHRHDRPRPSTHNLPCLWINTPLDDEGRLRIDVDCFVYDEFILRQTWSALSERGEIILPMDYRTLVEAVYDTEAPASGSPLSPVWKKLRDREIDATQKARLRLLPEPDPIDSFCGPAAQLTFDENENSAAWAVAQTRLGEESITVIPLEREGNCAWYYKDGIKVEVGLNDPASRETQLELLRRSLRISNRYAIDALKASFASLPLFAQSALLKECFPLWLKNGETSLRAGKRTLHLALDYGLGLVIDTIRGG
jgi:CRISPR-associated endonuclease/helicase Cas3